MVAQQARTASGPGSGVLLSGIVPPLADTYYQREQTGPDLASSLRPGEILVLVHGEETKLAPAAQGGTGKTQLAVEFAHAMWNTRAVEVLVWVTGASSESVIAGFAEAANMVDARAPDEGAETAAARFVSWLARTRRPWALIIDDLAELSDLEELWPAGASGRVLITTRLPAMAFKGPAFESRDLRVVPVSGLSRREALDYVASRLTDHPDQRIEALDLGEDLDGLPLGLAQATAVMSARRQGCREYRALLAERIGHMPAADGGSAAVLATWSIAAECAHELPPAGLAWPTLVLAAMLDHHGVPGAHRADARQCAGRRTRLPAARRTRTGRDRRRGRAAGNLAGRRRPRGPRGPRGRAGPARTGPAWTGPAWTGPAWTGPAWTGTAGLRLGAAGHRRRDAVEAGGSFAAVPRRAVAGAGTAVPRGHHVLEVDGGHEHPAARPGPRQRRGGQGQARRGV